MYLYSAKNKSHKTELVISRPTIQVNSSMFDRHLLNYLHDCVYFHVHYLTLSIYWQNDIIQHRSYKRALATRRAALMKWQQLHCMAAVNGRPTGWGALSRHHVPVTDNTASFTRHRVCFMDEQRRWEPEMLRSSQRWCVVSLPTTRRQPSKTNFWATVCKTVRPML